MNSLEHDLIATAKGELGVREIGSSNTGLEVNRYLASVGLGPGYPWCAAFYYYVHQVAFRKHNAPNPLPKSAYVPDYNNWAKRNDVVVQSPKSGDGFMVYSSSMGRYAHIGLVQSVNGNSFKTVEGNTNLNGSRTGIGVFELTRKVDGAYRFFRPLSLVDEGRIIERTANLVLGRETFQIPLLDGKTFVPLRRVAEYFKHEVGWVAEDNTPSIDGVPVGFQTALRQEGSNMVSYCYSRDLASALGVMVRWDGGPKVLTFVE